TNIVDTTPIRLTNRDPSLMASPVEETGRARQAQLSESACLPVSERHVIRRLIDSAPGNAQVEPRPARDGFHRVTSASSAYRLLPMPAPTLRRRAPLTHPPTPPTS